MFRSKLLSFCFLLLFLAALVRLFYWQVLVGSDLASAAVGQHRQGSAITAKRGDILAKDKSWLVSSGESWQLYAEIPKLKLPPKKIAKRIAPLLVTDVTDSENLLREIDRLEALLGRQELVWVNLKNKVGAEVKTLIEDMEIEGLGFEPVEARVYPEGSSSAHLLGFVGKSDEGTDIGYFGLEGYYDNVLSGKEGFLEREKDASGIPILLSEGREVSAVDGVDLITNIDKRIQLSSEKKLQKAIDVYGAKGGTVIVMDPKTGAILAMSSFPSYEPLFYFNYGDLLFSNPAISLSFEPGSVFKVLVMASALDANVIEPDTVCDICSGPYRVDKYLIETWDKKYYADSTMSDVIVHSDNVGMVFVGTKLGSEKLYDYLTKFGIGKKTGIDLQGESEPKLRVKDVWSEVDLATATFGQGVAVTPIQMVSAVSAIANKGIYLTPQVVDKISGDTWEEDIQPSETRRVISQEAAAKITLMMAEAAKKGEAKWTNRAGFRVAGKTGTAQIPISGHYDEEKTIASFVGFAPYDDPKFVMLVTLIEPSTSQWASETAAPLWYSIASDLFLFLGIQPEN